ncbi:MAG TPA: HAD hydrolase-like protein [Candidatus Eisenbacteria bacterium]|nr:HAD hydrolase-like protein [Candidatus Eisenbacteria bacterium]
MKKIVFDLDYTLLDTIAFKEALIAATGVPKEAWEETYKDTVAKKGFFEPGAFFDELAGRNLLTDDVAAAKDRFEGVLRTTEQYLYPEAKELVLALGRHKGEVEVDLMTFGEAKWQRSKVEHSGLGRMFQDVLYVETNKKEFVQGLGKGRDEVDEVILVNDNGKEMEEMVEAAPEHTYIWKSGGPKAAPKDWKHLKAESIGDLARVLEKQTGFELRREMREVREGIENMKVESGENVRVEIEMGDDDESGESKVESGKSEGSPIDPGTKGRRL